MNRYLVLLALPVIFLCSCQPTKKVHEQRLYLRGIDTSLLTKVNIPEPAIQKGELLSITVFSDNTEATNIYNQQQSSSNAITSASTDGTNSGGGRGYLVSPRGDILFHSLGPIHVEGLTKTQLIELLEQKLDTVLKHPYVEIRFLNKRVIMLGEVAKPGVINIPEERLTILDALALSGDMTNFGRKDNILVIREENGKRSLGRLNINDASIYKSEFFNLKTGDMVYIEPIRAKPSGTDQTLLRNVTLLTTFISVFAIVYSIFRR